MATTKVKPKTGAAVPADDSDTQPPISDAQATELRPEGGFTVMPSVPGPSGPPFGMGGDVTQPSDFAKEVAAATNVPSKGGPAVEALSVSSGKGQVGKFRRPQDTDSTTRAPEDTMPPIAPVSLGAPTPTPTPTPTPAPTPTPTSTMPPIAPVSLGAPTPSTAQPAAAQPAAAQQPDNQGFAQGDPRTLPAYQERGDLIRQFAQPYQRGDQNVSQLDPYIANDPDYAGMVNGHPIFMDEQRRVYMRDETGPGKETRHYADAQPGSQSAENGVQVVNEDKAAASRDAQARMTALMQTKEAIDAWEAQLKDYKAHHGEENPIQQLQLQGQLSSGTDFWSSAGRAILRAIPGVSEDMKKLEVARAQAAASYGQAWTKNLPTSQGTREALELPNTTEDFATQQLKVEGMKQAMAREARALQALSPHLNKKVEQLLTSIGQAGGSTGQGAGQNAPAGSTTRPAATPTPSPSASQRQPVNLDSDHDHSVYNSLPSGAPVIYKGKTYYKP